MKTRRIFKYPLQFIDTQSIQLPKGAQLLDVQRQDDTLMLWALVDPGAPTEHRVIEIAGTGNPFREGYWMHLATWQSRDGRFVWHVFIDGPGK